MGYATLSPLSVFELGGTPNTVEITIIPGGTTVGLKQINVPSWVSGKVKQAYLEIHFPWVINNHADFNWIDTCDGVFIGADGHPVDVLAIAIANHTLYMPASSTFTGDVRVIGTVDITAVVNQSVGSHFDIEIQNAVAHDNDLRLFYPYCVLKCYMETQ